MQIWRNGLRWISLPLLTLLCCGPSEEPEVYFSPGGGAQQAILERIEEAAESIDVAMYAFTSRELAWALVRARERGVRVRVLLDGDFVQNEYSKHRFLNNHGVQVRVDMSHLTRSGDFQGLMHHKFAVVDRQVVITGSYNWTASAQERNEENLLIFPRSVTLARPYSAQFEELWRRGTPLEAKLTEKQPLPSEVPILQASDPDALRANAGKSVRVRGIVYRVGHSERSNTYFINFGPGRSSFTGVIFRSAVKKFLEHRIDPRDYEGRKVELAGKLIDHPKYGLEIIVEDPKQVRFIASKGAE